MILHVNQPSLCSHNVCGFLKARIIQFFDNGSQNNFVAPYDRSVIKLYIDSKVRIVCFLQKSIFHQVPETVHKASPDTCNEHNREVLQSASYACVRV